MTGLSSPSYNGLGLGKSLKASDKRDGQSHTPPPPPHASAFLGVSSEHGKGAQMSQQSSSVGWAELLGEARFAGPAPFLIPLSC